MDEQIQAIETIPIEELPPTTAGTYSSTHHTENGQRYKIEDTQTVIAQIGDITTLTKGFRGETEIQTETIEFQGADVGAQGTPVEGIWEIKDGDKTTRVDLTGKGYCEFKPETWQSTWGSGVSGFSDRGLSVVTKGTKPVLLKTTVLSVVDSLPSPKYRLPK